MSTSATDLFMPDFSHIYIEDSARAYPLTAHVLSKFPRATCIEIDNYKEVFARSKQQFATQKQAAKLILAVKQPPFLYKGADVSQDFGNTHFYYTSSILNCLYNCEYCFLQGMFPGANVVIFVNIEDYFEELKQMLKQHPVYLSITYETDLLAFEHIAGLTAAWIQFATKEPDLTIEIRTKSVNIRALRHLSPPTNVILAWTISPHSVSERYEHKAPPLRARLAALEQALADGWQVRVCLDPILHVEHWQDVYRECIEQTFAVIPAEKIRDMSIGTFRISRDYLKKMRKERLDSVLLHDHYECREGVYSYSVEMTAMLLSFVNEQLLRHVPQHRIFAQW